MCFLIEKVYHIKVKREMEKFIKVILFLSPALCLLSFVFLLKVLFLGLYPDFNAYYHVSKYFLEGVNYYAHPELLSISYSYPPIDLLLFVPFTFFPFQSAEIFWTILNILLLITSLYYLTKIFSEKFFSKLNMLFMSFVFISFPTKFTLGMGQLNIFVLTILIIGFWNLIKKRNLLSGVLIGAALSVKFSPILLPIYFLLKFNKKVIVGILVFALLNIILILLFVPIQITQYYFERIIPDFLLSSWKLDYYNQSFAGVIGRSFGTEYYSSMFKNIVSLVACGACLSVIYKNKKKDILTTMLSIGVIMTISILFNTFSWQHHFVWLIVPFYATIFYLKKIKAKNNYYLLIAISYLLVSINFPNPNILPIFFQSHVFYGGIILLFVDLYLLKKATK